MLAIDGIELKTVGKYLMLMHFIDCLVEEIKDFFLRFGIWIVAYVLANYCGLRGPCSFNLVLLVPFFFVYILFNTYTRWVDGCPGCDQCDESD